ncbi:pyridoxal phosphate-dependent aminotransferase [Tanticharoenia sakaeratensis]|uniref:Aminotransferase n=1 Tax=Tanticharoenia sakaeratensis NBRC 103193 TaxID=1231623 RepID=A0A0D6MKV3_9PROT|nr:pyridoxal phosphate-dependent aminotransferase [Tanticharoenia sakaeratensis]GAN54095.1 aspartate aminotransferase A [Tanticharoenia sakaeratensis NBRC 103193]GBQ24719.1 aspartate aminotransferase [Tanticharoenia sakaeratensis NBRC 103193]
MSLISDRLNRISPSQTIAITDKARVLKAEGRDIISLSAGEPDFDTPENVKDAAIRAIREGQTKYTAVAGTQALRSAIAARLAADFGTDYTADEIVVSTGGKQSIFNAMVATLNPGDEVIIPTPAWVSYPDIVTLADGRPVLVPTDPAAGFKMTARQLADAITPQTKWLMLNSPCNPTGSAYTADELRSLCDVLLDHPHVWVFTDDIYAKLVYDGFVAQTVVQVEPKLRDRTVTMNGMSKAYAMTGWRVGYTAAPAALTRAMTKLQGQSTSNPCSIAQAAACEAASGPQDFIAEMVETYRGRRDLVVAAINAAPHLSCHVPQGAFYVFASMEKALGLTSAGGTKITSDEVFVTALLDETGVAAVHGTAFLCPGYFRISYATDTETLREACRRVTAFCEGLHT